jgi:hypothetical protein
MKTVLTAIISVFLALTASDASTVEPYSRPCRADDLIGLWKVVKWTSYLDDDRKLNSYAHAHQWYLFTPDGTLRSMTSTRRNPNEDLTVLAKLPAVISYRCTADGNVLTERKDLPSVKETWMCSVVTADRSDQARDVHLKKADVVMQLLGRDGRPIYVRQMRRVDLRN